MEVLQVFKNSFKKKFSTSLNTYFSKLVSSLQNFTNNFFSFSRMNKERMAFTLAEVLITLGIIGVVAAMTIPSLISNYKKVVIVSRLKQTYSILKQAERRAIEDDRGPDTWDMGSSDPYSHPIVENMLPYLTGVSKCKYDLNKHPTVYTDSGRVGYHTIWVNKALCLPNGAMIFAGGYGSNGRTAGINIYIDINGDAPPNKFGHDVFEAYINNSNMTDKYYMTYCSAEISFCPRLGLGKLNITREDLLNMCSQNGGNAGSNSCAVLIKDAGWTIPSDYPIKL